MNVLLVNNISSKIPLIRWGGKDEGFPILWSDDWDWLFWPHFAGTTGRSNDEHLCQSKHNIKKLHRQETTMV